MRTKPLLCCLLSILVTPILQAQRQVGLKIEDKLNTIDPIEINGFVGNRLDASYDNRILAQDVEKLIHPFTVRDEHSCWQSEFWGKWFTSAVLAYKYKPSEQLSAILKKAVSELIATQTADGYIGNYAPESHLKGWDIWGRKYCMLGLIAYYDLTKDKPALKAAEKEADFLIRELEEKNAEIVKMGNHRGMAASSVLEPICQLYVRTGNKKYLDFAEEIVRQWETSDGPQLISKADTPVGNRFPKPSASDWYGWQQGQKAYEMMSCYEGLLELYRITGNESFKNAAVSTWQNIMDTEINIAGSGAAMEAWFSGKALQNIPIEHFQETCVTVTWMKFNLQMLRLTGEEKYADAIEQTFYNALLGSMRPDGSDWAKYTPLSGQRLPGSEQCQMGLNCCVASGPRGLFAFPQSIVMQNKEGASVNFYVPGKYAFKTSKNKSVTLKQVTNYPKSGKIDIELEMAKAESMTLSLRIPKWNSQVKVSINGNSVENIASGNYLSINRNWNNEDKISIEFEMKGQLHTMGNNPEYFAITRGPVVLTMDERLSIPGLEAIIRPVSDKNGNIELTASDKENGDIWMVFSAKFIPESYTEYGAKPIDVELCDYASAGNTMNAYPFFKVWLPQLYNPRK